MRGKYLEVILGDLDCRGASKNVNCIYLCLHELNTNRLHFRSGGVRARSR